MIRTEKTHLKTLAGTHAGMTGKNNEDSFGVSAFLLDEESSTPVLLAVLADGIGGHNAGEVASALVVDTVSEVISQSDAADPLTTLNEAVQTASQRVQTMSGSSDGHKGMGSTLVTTWIIGKQLYTAYVGDSRIYLLRNRKLIRLTQDHSWIQEALDTGLITPEQAEGHPNAHVIRRYVGSPEPPEVDFRLRLDPSETAQQSIANQGMDLKNGDLLLLCSDGLTDLVNDEEIEDILNHTRPEKAINEMITLANERGGHDNTTIVLIQVPEGVFVEGALPSAAGRPETAKKPILAAVRPFMLGCMGILMVLVLVAAGYFGLQYLNGRNAGASPSPTDGLTKIPGFLENTETLAVITDEISTPTTGVVQTDATIADTNPDGSAASDGISIPPPPDPAQMTAVPTHTRAPTQTATATATRTATP